MGKEKIISDILELEWRMMQGIEGAGTSQEDRLLFEKMRRAQFDAWAETPCASYLKDLTAASAAGRNLQHEKFTRMLKNIAPAEYAAAEKTLPPVSEEVLELTSSVWEILRQLTEKFSAAHPLLGLSGRPLLAEDETDIPSVETYQTAELMTYSAETLKAFRDFLVSDTEAGGNIVFEIQKNTVISMGFESLDDAEKQIALEALSRFELSTGCSGCGMTPMD